MEELKKCKLIDAELNLGGCAYGSVRLCCKSCAKKSKCKYVCGKSYEDGLCRYEMEGEKMIEVHQKKPINRIARYKTALQMMAAGTRKFKASRKHIEMLHNEEFDKELERLIYEQQKFFRDVGRALRNEEKGRT